VASYVVVTTTTVPGTGYGQPDRRLRKGQVVVLSAAEVSTIGAGNLRATTAHDQLGESAGCSNGD
jgi:hypothetical protein